MSAPTMQQLSDMSNVAGGGAQQSNGAFLNGTAPYYEHPIFKALDAARQEFSIGPSDAIDLFAGYQIWKLLAPSITPDSSSGDSILAFVGRTMEIYAEQNP